MKETGGHEPQHLRQLATAIGRRLSSAGVVHKIRFIPPGEVSWWSLAVDLEDGIVDDLYASPRSDRFAVVPDRQEEVSSKVAVEYVAMCADLLSEREWWLMVREEQRCDRQAAAQQRRERWRARLKLGRLTLRFRQDHAFFAQPGGVRSRSVIVSVSQRR